MTPLKEVQSAVVKAWGYDAASETLAIQFKAGENVYQFQGVPPDVAEAFGSAESIGKAYGATIRGRFTYEITPLTDEPA